MLLANLLHSAAGSLAEAGVDTPRIDAELLLGNCLGKSRTELFLSSAEDLQELVVSRFHKLLQRRLQREPLAYILGVQEFWSLDFCVTPDVLIPRPETELLLEKTLSCCKDTLPQQGIVLDLCCGSGIIAVVLALELGRPVLAVDVSLDAICVARKNARRHNVSHLISFLQSDLLSGVAPLPVFSLIVSNPPYVSREEMSKGLQPEVDLFEPHLALDGGDGGVQIIEKIREQAFLCMLSGAELFMEVGSGQKKSLLDIFSPENDVEQSFNDVWVAQDYAGHDRILHVKK